MSQRETQPGGAIPQRWWMVGAVAVAGLAPVVAMVVLSSDGTMHAGSGIGGHMEGSSMPSQMGSMNDVARPAAPEQAGRVVRVNAIDTLAFEPAAIEVSVGETVAFEVTNEGATTHEFMLAPRAMQAHHDQHMASHGGMTMGDSPHAVILEPGETKTVTMRFVGEGELVYGCHVPGHYQGGMVGLVTAVT